MFKYRPRSCFDLPELMASELQFQIHCLIRFSQDLQSTVDNLLSVTGKLDYAQPTYLVRQHEHVQELKPVIAHCLLLLEQAYKETDRLLKSQAG